MWNSILRVAMSRSLWSPMQRINAMGCKKTGIKLQNYATFAFRDILHEGSDEAGTLVTRFAKYIALERCRSEVVDQPVSDRIHFADYFPITDVRQFQKTLYQTSNEQLPSVLKFAFTYRPNADPARFAMILNECDGRSLRMFDSMDEKTIFNTLYAFLFLIPNWITRLDFYVAAMKRLSRPTSVNIEFFTEHKENFVQLCFYLGLNKKTTNPRFSTSSLLEEVFTQYVDKHLSTLSTLDVAIIANALYKTATKTTSELFNARLIEEVLKLDVNDKEQVLEDHGALLVTFLKAMRFQRVHSNEVCEYLKLLCQDSSKLQSLEPRGQMHLFTYLATNLWDCSVCSQNLINQFVSSLKNPEVHEIRAKDISNFLWCCAQLNCKLTDDQCQITENTLWDRMRKTAELKRYPDQLVDSCLSFWILGHHSKDLLMVAKNEKENSRFNGSGNRSAQPKVDSRLIVLLSAVSIERPNWNIGEASYAKNDGKTVFDLEAKVPTYLLNAKTNGYDLEELSEKWSQEDGIESVQICCPIKGINIPGFHVQLKDNPDPILVEVISSSQRMKFSGQPVGINRLKIRLLKALKHRVITVS